MSKQPAYFRYWGKARPDKTQGAHYHLLAYHCLDVAAVGWYLLNPEQLLCRRLARQLAVAKVAASIFLFLFDVA